MGSRNVDILVAFMLKVSCVALPPHTYNTRKQTPSQTLSFPLVSARTFLIIFFLNGCIVLTQMNSCTDTIFIHRSIRRDETTEITTAVQMDPTATVETGEKKCVALRSALEQALLQFVIEWAFFFLKILGFKLLC